LKNDQGKKELQIANNALKTDINNKVNMREKEKMEVSQIYYQAKANY